jgi:MFS family permease
VNWRAGQEPHHARQVAESFGLATAAGLPMVPLAGILVDRYGARRVVGAAEALQGVDFLGYLAVTTIPGLIGAAVLAAAGPRLFWSAYSALVSAMALPADRDRWFGLAGALQSAGLSLGGLAAGALVAYAGTAAYRLVVAGNGLSFLFAAGLILAARQRRRVAPARRLSRSARGPQGRPLRRRGHG